MNSHDRLPTVDQSSVFLSQDAAKLHRELISNIQGPTLVIGAGGFIGVNALSILSSFRSDVIGLVRRHSSWRLDHYDKNLLVETDINDANTLNEVLSYFKPKTVFNFAAYGAYPQQREVGLMTKTNIDTVRMLGEWCLKHSTYLVHAGSSSEYGSNCSGPPENSASAINSAYGATKLAGTMMLQAQALDGLRASILRLYSIYGPWEEPTRLVPTLIRLGVRGHLPTFSAEHISRDFVYVTDALEAFWRIASYQTTEVAAAVFNIGTGVATTMSEVAESARALFGLTSHPVFSGNLRDWDLQNWYADSSKAKQLLDWTAKTSFIEGLRKTATWYASNDYRFLDSQHLSSDSPNPRSRQKISAIIACYKDQDAIPIMYQRLVTTFRAIGCDYEIIFVNDCSPDESQAVITELSRSDSRVIGVRHTRNFGSQASFLSGLCISTGDASVLLDGDLQDPPELISEFYSKFIEGYDVVYGVRTSREGPLVLQVLYKLFYRVMGRLSSFPIPRDSGDFSLMSRSVVRAMVAFPERNLFLRTNRAFIGGRQLGIPYHRPERMFGKSTNNFMRNIQWAIEGIISNSKKPMSYLGVFGACLSSVSFVAVLIQGLLRLIWPSLAPAGLITVISLIGLFGSLNLLAVSLIGEYVGRILDEARGRPRFIQHSVTRSGIEQAAEKIDS